MIKSPRLFGKDFVLLNLVTIEAVLGFCGNQILNTKHI